MTMQKNSSARISSKFISPTHHSEVHCFLPLVKEDAMGHMTETAIFSQWIHKDYALPLSYARWNGGEVDIVSSDTKKFKPQWAGEIKWNNRGYDKSSELKNLISFCEKNNLKDAIVTTYDISASREINGIHVNFIPSALYAFNTGYYTIARQTAHF
jgi:hypothetical protein